MSAAVTRAAGTRIASTGAASTGVAAEGFWAGRRVLLTGHTGFKGAWLHLWLRLLGADVTGFALPPATEPSLWSLIGEDSRSVLGDIRDADLVRNVVASVDPEIVIHMAAQALVRESYRDPVATYATNVQGTAILLASLRAAPRLEATVVVTSDKVYANDAAGRAFDESDRLGGHDPYSSSKACTEILTASFRDSFFAGGAALATARAGNVIGGGDWSTDRLIPDCMRALGEGRPVRLRNPGAVRPWQHVLEPLSGYLALAQALVQSPALAPTAVNFGPDPASFRSVSEVVETFSARFAGAPGWEADLGSHPAEAPHLTLASDLAWRTLGWTWSLDLEQSLAWTADWYRAQRAGENMLEVTLSQLHRYREIRRARVPVPA
jgi:CDP-glucose 4,6-dehydratase